ncbi:hypothetical protein M3Y98_00867600 [Aphelenchoides besseyi]|nr:hypothetical protein M3Y98_00867600 [Aphelenchoides besseyi]KAI6211244.1 hypothetical protein M3Y96_00413200 [Aphelenchoides besseyi]
MRCIYLSFLFFVVLSAEAKRIEKSGLIFLRTQFVCDPTPLKGTTESQLKTAEDSSESFDSDCDDFDCDLNSTTEVSTTSMPTTRPSTTRSPTTQVNKRRRPRSIAYKYEDLGHVKVDIFKNGSESWKHIAHAQADEDGYFKLRAFINGNDKYAVFLSHKCTSSGKLACSVDYYRGDLLLDEQMHSFERTQLNESVDDHECKLLQKWLSQNQW